MYKVLFIACFLLLLWADWALYRREVQRLSRPLRRLWLCCSVAVYLLPLVVLLTYSDATARTMRLTIWIIWLFMLNAIPRIVYVLISRLGRLVRRPRAFGIVGAALALTIVVTMILGATVGRSRIEVRQTTIECDRLPASFDGLRVALFADVHLGNLIHSHKQLNRLVEAINSARPDVVVFGGDMVNLTSDEFTPAVAQIFSRVESRYGRFAVLGNHDLGLYVRDSVAHPFAENVDRILERYREAGWQPLVNQTVYIPDGVDSISLSGVSFPVEKRHMRRAASVVPVDFEATYAGVPDSLFNICVSHTPELWSERIVNMPYGDLTLSGHVHSMQMKFSLLGRSWSPAKWRFGEWSGLYSRNGKYLYINDGVGYVVYPMRIGTRPEVSLIVLKSAAR
ncbi:phosphoesterase [Bacteroidia bacterium]|nr:phosphoesterase [Bacteroidia bacterium]